jgi:putative exosortase-associated protein (TIGR04073 family)
MRKIALLGIFTLLALPAVASAHTERGEYTAMSKLGRGLAGLTTGFLELPGNIVAVSRDQGAVGGMTIGFAKGIGMIPVRELVGVYDFVTAPFPAPGHYEPVLEPEYPWSYFEGAHEARLSAAMRGETRAASRDRTAPGATSGARKYDK